MTSLLASYGNPHASRVAQELDQKIEKLIADAVGLILSF
jgi:hypothetical protein